MTMSKLVPALIAAAALFVAGCGDDEDTGSASAAGNGVDRAFVAEMIPHHESAVEMAQIALKRGRSAFVKKLADDIIQTQTAEIATLRSEDEGLDTAGVKRGSLGVPEHMMGMDGDIATLKTAKPFDAAFLKLMIPHHEGALVMAKAELAKGKDGELRTLAQDIIEGQTREIAAMKKQLGDDGGSGDPMTGGHGDAMSGGTTG